MKNRFGLLMASLAFVVLVGAGCTTQQAEPAPMEDGMDNDMMGEEMTAVWPAEGEPIKIGWVGPLTGDLASIGGSMQDAVELAVAEVNAEGGINGHLVEMMYEDGGCDGKKGSSAGSKLLNIDKVVAILGGACTGETMAIAPTAEELEVPMISAASTAPSVTDAGDFVFRIVPSDAFQAKFAANYAYNELGKRKVVVLHSLSDYGQSLGDVFARTFKELGGTVTMQEAFADKNTDFRTTLTKVKNSDADFIYFVAYTEAGVAALKQKEELGIDLQIVSGDTFTDPLIQEAAGAEGTIFFASATKDDESFKSRFLEAAEREDMTAYTPQQYDAATLLLSIIGDVGIKGTAVRDALYAVVGYEGVAGNITFDENGDLEEAAYDRFVIENGAGIKQ